MRDRTALGEPLAAVVDPKVAARSLGKPLRAWSLAVSFLGDCIVPRGGDVGLGTLAEALAALGVEPGVTRTAMSRLAGDGWVRRRKVGRSSFYSLTPKALAESEAASQRIYAARHPVDPCGWRVYLGGGLVRAEQRRLRTALHRRGAAELSAHVYILPAGEDRPSAEPVIALTADPLPEAEARALVERAFDLGEVASAYAEFLGAFAPVGAALGAGAKLFGLEAVAMRVLLIHAFRRIVLRDPMIPAPYLPEGWPGIAARETAVAIWRALFLCSEAWLDANAASSEGPLPPRSNSSPRFESGCDWATIDGVVSATGP